MECLFENLYTLGISYLREKSLTFLLVVVLVGDLFIRNVIILILSHLIFRFLLICHRGQSKHLLEDQVELVSGK